MSISITNISNNSTLSGLVWIQASSTQPFDYVAFNIDGTERLWAPAWQNNGIIASSLLDTSSCANMTHTLYATPYSSYQAGFQPTNISGCITWVDFSDKSTMFQDIAQTIPIVDGARIYAIKDKTGTLPAFIAPTALMNTTFGLSKGFTAPIWNDNQVNFRDIYGYNNGSQGAGTAYGGLGMVNMTGVVAYGDILISTLSTNSPVLLATSGEVFIVYGIASAFSTPFLLSASITGALNHPAGFAVARINNPGAQLTQGFYAEEYPGGTQIASLDGNTGACNYISTNKLTNFYVGNIRCDGYSNTQYINGVLQSGSLTKGTWFAQVQASALATGPTAPWQHINALNIGCYLEGYAAAYCGGGQIGEILIYNKTLTSQQRSQVEQYLIEKWGTPYSGVWPTPYTYSANTSSTNLSITTSNISGLTVPSQWLQPAYPHIKLFQIAYNSVYNVSGTQVIAQSDSVGQPLPPYSGVGSTSNSGLAAYSFDIINGLEPQQLKSSSQFIAISYSGAGPYYNPLYPTKSFQSLTGWGISRTSNIKYLILADLPTYEIISYAQFARQNSYSVENGFLHASSNIPLNYISPTQTTQSWPVRSWWDAHYVTGVIINNAIPNIYTSLYYDGVVTYSGAYVTSSLDVFDTGKWSTTKVSNLGSPMYLSNTSGDYLLVAYSDPIDQINIGVGAASAGGWSGVIEYPYAVDYNNVPTGWAIMQLLTDTTANLTKTGQMTWYPFPSSKTWVPCVAMSGGSLTADSSYCGLAQYPGYYIRLKTVKTGTAPLISGVFAADYINSGPYLGSGTTTNYPGIPNGNIGIPSFCWAADTGNIGYLSNAQLTGVGSIALGYPGFTANFAYQSRIFSKTSNLWTGNYSNTGFRLWATGYFVYTSGYDGIFLDNSSASITPPQSQVIENISNRTIDYSTLLNQIVRGPSNNIGRPGYVIQNIGPSINSAIPTQLRWCPYGFMEQVIQDNMSWKAFETLSLNVQTYAYQYSPPPLIVIDSYCSVLQLNSNPPYLTSSNSNLQQAQLLSLAAYYMLANSQTYFGPYTGMGTRSDMSYPRWWGAMAINIGQPLGSMYIFASGYDPDHSASTTNIYRIYARQFTNGLVLYKPLSYSSTTGIWMASSSTTTHNLNGNYWSIDYNGNLNNANSITGISLQNAQGAILLNANYFVPPPILGSTIYTVEGEAIIVTSSHSLPPRFTAIRRGLSTGYSGPNAFGTGSKYSNRFHRVAQPIGSGYYIP